MLWGQRIIVYTDHKNLIYDALGSTSDRVFRWRLLLEEYGPEIIYIKGEENTVADAISRLDFSPKKNPNTAKQNWMILTKKWCKIDHFAEPESKQNMDLNYAFAIHSDEEEISPLTISEIAEEQLKDKALQQQIKSSKLVYQLIENTLVLYKEGKLVIPKNFNIER
jgi:hypothetical protein